MFRRPLLLTLSTLLAAMQHSHNPTMLPPAASRSAVC
jgi:hypothetical protein